MFTSENTGAGSSRHAGHAVSKRSVAGGTGWAAPSKMVESLSG